MDYRTLLPPLRSPASFLSWAALHRGVHERAFSAGSANLLCWPRGCQLVGASYQTNSSRCCIYSLIIEPPWSFAVVTQAIIYSILQVAVGFLVVRHCLVAGLCIILVLYNVVVHSHRLISYVNSCRFSVRPLMCIVDTAVVVGNCHPHVALFYCFSARALLLRYCKKGPRRLKFRVNLSSQQRLSQLSQQLSSK